MIKWSLLIFIFFNTVMPPASSAGSTTQPRAEREQQRTALIHLKQAVREDPRAYLPRAKLGALYGAMAEWPNAETQLRRALTLGDTSPKTLLELLDALAAQLKYTEIVEAMDHAPKMQGHNQATALTARGEALLVLDRPDEAEQDFLRAVALAPELSRAELGLGRVALARGNPTKALELTRKVLAREPDSPESWRFLGQVEYSLGRLQRALAAYDRALDQAPGSVALIVERTVVAIELGRLDEAETMIAGIRDQIRDAAVIANLQGLMSLQRGNAALAREKFEDSLQLRPGHARTNYFLGRALAQLNETEQALTLLSAYHYKHPSDQAAAREYTIVALETGRFDSTNSLAARLLEANPFDAELLEAARIAEIRAGNYDRASQFERRIIELNGTTETLSRGINQVMRGDLAGGAETLAEARGPANVAILAQATTYLQRLQDADLEGAVAVARQMQQQLPNSRLPWLLLGGALLRMDRGSEAGEAFQHAWSLAPGDPRSGHQLAMLALRDGDLPRAEAYYETIADHHPGHLRSLLRASTLALRRGADQTGRERLREAVSFHPESIDASMRLAALELRLGNAGDTLAVLDAMPSDATNTAAYLTLLFGAQLRLLDYPAALTTARTLAKTQPRSLGAQLRVAKALLLLGRSEEATKVVLSALSTADDVTIESKALVGLLSLDANNQEASSLWPLLFDKFPTHRTILDLDLRRRLAVGDVQGASDGAATAMEHYPDEANWMLLAARAAVSAGQSPRAEKLLRDWAGAHPRDTVARKALAAHLLTTGHLAEALELYRAVVAIAPLDAQSHNNVAWLLLDTDPETALRHARQAVTIRAVPAYLETLGIALKRNGLVKESVASLRAAMTGEDPSPETIYQLADALIENGSTTEGRKLLRQALDSEKAFDSRPLAEGLLERFADSRQNTP